jgi:hypothetical protein
VSRNAMNFVNIKVLMNAVQWSVRFQEFLDICTSSLASVNVPLPLLNEILVTVAHFLIVGKQKYHSSYYSCFWVLVSQVV